MNEVENMGKFLCGKVPPLVVMIQFRTPDEAIDTMKKALDEGAEAFGVQICKFLPEYRTPEVYRRVFAAANGLPIYATNYRKHSNEGKTDDALAEELLEIADCGATLLDVMGDFFDPQPGELTEDEAAVEKQMRLIERIHARGAEALMSSHVKKYIPEERVVTILQAHERRGADIAKLVVGDTTPEEAMENLRICSALRQKLGIPYLFLSGKQNTVLRRCGPMLGVCCWLCRYGDEELATKSQPILRHMKAVRDNFEFSWEEEQ